MLIFEFLSRFITTLIFALLLACNSYAQLFPVQASVQITPPYSPYLSDYTAPGMQKIMVQLISNDITISDHPIKFRLTIEGVGITIRTKPAFIPASHTLNGGGAPTLLYGEDLIEYFHPNNLDFAGISRRDFEKSGKLPEGVYRFMLEVVDYHRNVVLSNKALTVVWIVLNDPPLLNFPRNHAKVTLIDPTNIAFTWTPRHTGSPNGAFSTEYVFKLVELITSPPNWVGGEAFGATNQQLTTINQSQANQAILSQPPIFETTLTQSQFVYGPAEPALLPGRKYAWQVQARDEEGRDIFKNQGKSEVFVFQFGDLLGVPENLRLEGGNDVTLTIRWEPAMNGEMPDTYNIRYKQVSADSWFEMLSGEQRFATIANLKPNTEYDVQVRAKKDKTYSDYTSPLRVKTKDKKDIDFTCGAPPVVSAPKNLTPLTKLVPGDVITNDDWRVVVTEVTKAENGIYEGKGLMAVKMFNGASIKVTFSGGIDSSYEMMLGGRIKSVYNRGSAMSTVVDEMHKIGEKKKEEEKLKKDTLVLPVPIVIAGTIDSVYFDKGRKEIVVIDTDGKKTTYAQPVNAATKEAMPAQLTDAAGNTVVVAKDGMVTRGTSGTASGVTAKSLNALDKMILSSLKKYKKAIEDYYASIGQQPPKGKGPSVYDEENDYIPAELPSCLEKYKDKLDIIYYNLIVLTDSTSSESEGFNTRVKRQISEGTNATEDAVDDVVCKAVVEDIDNNRYYSQVAFKAAFESAFGEIEAGNNCFLEGWTRYNEVDDRYESEGIAFYAAVIRFVLCATEMERCTKDDAYTCGFTNGLFQELDWITLLDDLSDFNISKEDVKKTLSCVVKSIPIGERPDKPTVKSVVFKCVTGIDLRDLQDQLKSFITDNWDEPYYQGQAAAFVLTLISPMKTGTLKKLENLPRYASRFSKLEILSKAKNADELVIASKTLVSNVTELVGKYDWGLVKRYFQHIQEVTGRAVGQKQIDKLKGALRAKEYKKLSEIEIDIHRKDFNSKKNKLILEWEKETGQKWPTYTEPYYTKTGLEYKKVGDPYDAHHIIENQYGGENEWWNIHPAKFPDEHQGGIHGVNSPAKQLFK